MLCDALIAVVPFTFGWLAVSTSAFNAGGEHH